MNDTNKLEAVTNLTQISNTAFIQKINIQSRSTLYNQILVSHRSNTYLDTAFWDSSYSNDTLKNLMDIINAKTYSDSIRSVSNKLEYWF